MAQKNSFCLMAKKKTKIISYEKERCNAKIMSQPKDTFYRNTVIEILVKSLTGEVNNECTHKVKW